MKKKEGSIIFILIILWIVMVIVIGLIENYRLPRIPYYSNINIDFSKSEPIIEVIRVDLSMLTGKE